MLKLPNIDLPHPNHLEWQEIIDDDQHEFWDSDKFVELRDEIEEGVRQDIEESVHSELYDDDAVMARIGRDALAEGYANDDFYDQVSEEANPRIDEEIHNRIIKWLENHGRKSIDSLW